MSKIQAMFNSRGRRLFESEKPAVEALYAKYASVALKDMAQPVPMVEKEAPLTIVRYVAPAVAGKGEELKQPSGKKRSRRVFRGTRSSKLPTKVLVTTKVAA